MRVAFWTKRFPDLYETFILNQVLQLRDSGIKVDVIATQRANYPHADTRLATAGMQFDSTAADSDKLFPKNNNEGRRDQIYYERQLPPSRLARLRRVGVTLTPHFLPRPRSLYRILRHARNTHRGPLGLAWAAVPFLNNRHYDLVHCQWGHFGLMAVTLRTAGIFRCPIVTSFRGYDISAIVDRKHIDYAPLFASGDAFTPVCQAFSDRLRDAGCPSDNIKVIRSPIDCSKLEFQPRKHEPGQRFQLLSIGRLNPKKGFHFALRAARQLINSGFQLHYSIVGDGSYRRELEQLIARLRLGEHVTLHGWLPHKEALAALYQSHVYLQPSSRTAEGNMEGIPNALKEAMATGMPVIATRHSGIPELVTNGMSGFLVPEGDVTALANCLTQLLGNSESWPSLGKFARQRVLETFDIRPVTESLIDLYESLART